MSRTTRRLLTAAATASVVALALTGCVFGGGGGESTPAPSGDGLTGSFEVVSFYPEGTSEWDRVAALAEEFTALHPGLEAKLVFGGGQDTPAIEARWRAGNPPEVNFGFFDLNREDGGDYVAAGQVEPLTKAMDEPLEGYDSSWKDAILPGVLSLLTLPDGEIYAAPETVTTLQFFYNAKLFAEHDIEVPKTFDELIDAADQLRDANVTPFTVTGTFLPYMQMYWDYLALRYVGYDGVASALAGETAMASLPGASEAAADLERLVAEGNFTAGFRGIDFTAAQMNFFQGNAAMILMGSWLVGEMADAIPEGFEVGTFPFPTVSGGNGSDIGLFGTVNAYTVAADSANPEAGVAFLHFGAEKENQDAMVGLNQSISAYRGVPSPEGFENVSATLEEGAAFSPSYMGIFSTSPAVQAAYQEPIARLFFGEIDAATMLTQMSEGLLAAE